MTRLRQDRHTDTTIIHGRGRLLARAVVLLFAAALVAQFLHVALAAPADGAEAPDFALKTTQGANVRLSEYRSDVVAIAFWASWCGECRQNLADLQSLQQSLAPRGLQVLAVSFDEDRDDATEAAQAVRTSYPMLLDAEGETGRLYDIRDLPSVVLVDREGRLRAVLSGRRSVNASAMAEQIRPLLDE